MRRNINGQKKKQLMEEMLEHSAKGTSWKEHKYTMKRVKGGKVRYEYERGKNKNITVYSTGEKDNYTEAGKSLYETIDIAEGGDTYRMYKNYSDYNDEKYGRQIGNPSITSKDIVSAAKQKAFYKSAQRYGASGMPTNLINKMQDRSERKVERLAKSVEEGANFVRMMRDFEFDSDILSGRKGGGMPSDVRRKALRRTKFIG